MTTNITLHSIENYTHFNGFCFYIQVTHTLTHEIQCILYFYNKNPTDGIIGTDFQESNWVQPMLPVKEEGRMRICRTDNFTKIYMLIFWKSFGKVHVQIPKSTLDIGGMKASKHQHTSEHLHFFFLFKNILMRGRQGVQVFQCQSESATPSRITLPLEAHTIQVFPFPKLSFLFFKTPKPTTLSVILIRCLTKYLLVIF